MQNTLKQPDEKKSEKLAVLTQRLKKAIKENTLMQHREKIYDEQAVLRQELDDAIEMENLKKNKGHTVPAHFGSASRLLPIPWRTRHTTTTAQFDMMRSMGMETDCKITVNYKESQTPHVKEVHRLQLIRASPVFEAMLTGDMLEAKTGEIIITDLPPNVVDNLLDFIYTDEVNLKEFEEACMVAFAAEKYQIKHLLDISVSVINKFLTPQNVWTALKLANLLGLPDLQDSCVEVLQDHTIDCICSEKFIETTEENLFILLEQNELNVKSNELLLVNATINWARHEAQRRGLTGDDVGVRTVIEPNILSLLRLATIPTEQFKTGPGISDWLTQSEKEQILECQELESSQNISEHLSSSKIPREYRYNYGEHKKRKLHFCKRNAITIEDNFKLLNSVCNCTTCLNLFYFLDMTYFARLYKCNYKCAHATAVFRVNSKCSFLGFECQSRIFNNPTDPTLLSSNIRPCYNENIIALLFNNGPTMVQSPLRGSQLILHGEYMEKTMYDSHILWQFSKTVKLAENNWYILFVMFYCDDDENIPMEYPYCTRPSKVVCKKSGVEFVFQNENIPSCHTCENDGVFKTMVFTT